MERIAASRSTAYVRSAVPPPAPAAHTTAEAPTSCWVKVSRFIDSTSARTAAAPVASTSGTWSGLRTHEDTSSPRSDSSRARRSATLPCPPMIVMVAISPPYAAGQDRLPQAPRQSAPRERHGSRVPPPVRSPGWADRPMPSPDDRPTVVPSTHRHGPVTDPMSTWTRTISPTTHSPGGSMNRPCRRRPAPPIGRCRRAVRHSSFHRELAKAARSQCCSLQHGSCRHLGIAAVA